MSERDDAHRRIAEGLAAADNALDHKTEDDFIDVAREALPKMREATLALTELADEFGDEKPTGEALLADHPERDDEEAQALIDAIDPPRRWWEFWK